MNLALAKTDVRAAGEAFDSVRGRLPGSGKVAELRHQAFDAFERAGLPHRRIEDWKYTDLRALMREVLPLAAAPDAAALARAEAALNLQTIENARKLVLVDGVFAPKLSDLAGLEQGLRIGSLREQLEAGGTHLFSPPYANPMAALNAAMMTDGVVIDIAEGIKPARPLHVVHIATVAQPAAMFTRSLLTLGKSAAVTLVESYIAAGGATVYQVHDSLVVSIGDHARLDHVRLTGDSPEAFNISAATISLGLHACFNTFGLTSGAGVSRYQPTIVFAGEGSEVTTNGVNLLNGRQHADTTLFMEIGR